MTPALELRQFHGLESLKVETLLRADLIIGGNNTGRIPLIEAMIPCDCKGDLRLMHGFTTQSGLFARLDRFIDCPAGANEASPHEKVRFPLWSIVAQGPSAKDRPSIPIALQANPPNGNAGSFRPLCEPLLSVAA